MSQVSGASDAGSGEPVRCVASTSVTLMRRKAEKQTNSSMEKRCKPLTRASRRAVQIYRKTGLEGQLLDVAATLLVVLTVWSIIVDLYACIF